MKSIRTYANKVTFSEHALNRVAIRTRLILRCQSIYQYAVVFVKHMQWPHWLAFIFILGSSMSWILSGMLHAAAIDITAKNATLYHQTVAVASTPASISLPQTLAPPEDQFFEDISEFFFIAQDSGIGVGQVDYKRELNAKAHIVTRQVELHMMDDYPHIKQFIGNVLSEFPHAILQELRVDRHDALKPEAIMLVRFSFFYEEGVNTVAMHP